MFTIYDSAAIAGGDNHVLMIVGDVNNFSAILGDDNNVPVLVKDVDDFAAIADDVNSVTIMARCVNFPTICIDKRILCL